MIKTDNGDYIMSDFDIVSSIDWHDGVLLEVKTTFKESAELIDNHKSGNISNGYIKKIKNKRIYKFFLYFSDGLLSMSFKNLQLIKPLE